eukprot:TRINITY_DN2553_c0_g1_i2.p1 TRINITY_DN2553_c0_g1~~TRINITY_DN2553_c0_g1_i2.p1  ORF type:complete len:320 (+),score=24.56 TRINITY_DN2553_c0_g1_i2:177-1136(+)
MNINKLLKVSTLAGKILLENGAETYRVEETIVRICLAFKADNAESFVIPTGIIVTINHNDQTSTLLKRITSRSIDLNKIDKINNLSREIQNSSLSLEDFENELIKIDNILPYNIFTKLIVSSLSAGSFALLFGGNLKDFFSAFLIGTIIKIILSFCEKLNINEFFKNFLCGSITALFAILLVKFHLGANLDMIIIGSIMLLVPGLTITNAIRDTIAGDILSGITKACEALLIAVSIAGGTGAVLSVFLSNLQGTIKKIILQCAQLGRIDFNDLSIISIFYKFIRLWSLIQYKRQKSIFCSFSRYIKLVYIPHMQEYSHG